MTAATEFVVPKSIPMAFAMTVLLWANLFLRVNHLGKSSFPGGEGKRKAHGLGPPLLVPGF
jgi:hypothetical protein